MKEPILVDGRATPHGEGKRVINLGHMSSDSSDCDKPEEPRAIASSVTRSIAKREKVGLFGKLAIPTRPKRSSSQLPSKRTKARFSPNRSSSEPRYPTDPRSPRRGDVAETILEQGGSTPGTSTTSKESLDWDPTQNIDLRVDILRNQRAAAAEAAVDELLKQRSISGVLEATLGRQTESQTTSEDEVFLTPADGNTPEPPRDLRRQLLKRTAGRKLTPPSPPKVSRKSTSSSTATLVNQPLVQNPGPSGVQASPNLQPISAEQLVIPVLTPAAQDRAVAVANAAAARMADQILDYKVAIEVACSFTEEEVDSFNFDNNPSDRIKKFLEEADDKRCKLTSAMGFLLVKDSADYDTNYKAKARNAKRIIIEFIDKGQKILLDRELAARDAANAHVSEKDRLHAAAVQIKTDRVQRLLSNNAHNCDTLCTQLRSLITEESITDRMLEGILDTLATVNKEVDEQLRDLDSLYGDAVACGLEREAKEISDASTRLKNRRSKTLKKVQELKKQHGLEARSSGSRGRLKDMKPPLFNGSLSAGSSDLYTFMTEFAEYTSINNFSNEEQVDALRKTCLQGAAKSIVYHMKNLKDIWDKLKSSYGDASLLINAKMKEIEKLGRCPESTEKKKDWFIETHAKIARLHEIATEHKQTEDLYHSSTVGFVKNLLPEKMKTELREEVYKFEEQNHKEISKEQLFNLMLQFLRDKVQTETFNLRFDAMSMKPAEAAGGSQRQHKPPENQSRFPQKPKKAFTASPGSKPVTNKPGSGQNRGGSKKQTQSSTRQTQGGQPTPQRAKPQFQPQPQGPPKGIHCVICQEEHFFLFECRNFQNIDHEQRINLAHILKVCFRCLRSDSRVYRADLDKWYEDHKKNCKTDFQCQIGNCCPPPGKDSWRQRHIVMCEFHHGDNEQRLEDFVATLDPAKMVPNLKFFFLDHWAMSTSTDGGKEQILEDGTVVLPEVTNPSIYMLQTIPGAKGLDLQAFFDSGCSSATASSRAYSLMDCEEARPGPTWLNVAGGKSVKIPHGDIRFTLDIAGPDKKKATIVALRMDQITCTFPYWPLQAAWEDLNDHYLQQHPDGEPLPLVDEGVGGVEVDLMIGIKYNQYFPKLLFMLPSGLGIYEAQFQTVSGRLGVLGGTHESWGAAMTKAHFLGPTAFFTAEVRAQQSTVKNLYFIDEFQDYFPDFETPAASLLEPLDFQNDEESLEPSMPIKDPCKKKFPQPSGEFFSPNVQLFSSNLAELGQNELGMNIAELFEVQVGLIGGTMSNQKNPRAKGGSEDTEQPLIENNLLRDLLKNCVYAPPTLCTNSHCSRHDNREDWMARETWEIGDSSYSILEDEKRFLEAEEAGSEVTYRCVACRNCVKCKDGDNQEKMSLNEEVEEALLIKSLRYDPEAKKLWAGLPFIKDPATNLKPNRFLAEKIFDRQMRVIDKNPEMKADVLKSHSKLLDRGFVMKWEDIPEMYQSRLETIGGPGYFIPWQIVYKIASLSTPVRMVMNGSCATPGGESLNNCLAKGANSLTRILDILISFRMGACALTFDIKMAYNGVFLEPEYYKFQKYLWKEGLDINNPTVIMVIITIIYGIKPSGQQTIASLKMLADYVIQHHRQHHDGAMVIKKKTYMDDGAAATRNQEESRTIAKSVMFVLELAGMAVKDFTFSGSKPSDIVSADEEHVGILGYLWESQQDLFKLDIKELCFDKPKKGKPAPSITGNISEALKKCFTKRQLVSQCAKVFDPLGLATPLTAKLKLDLHEVSDLKVSWDEKLVERLLPAWVENLSLINSLRTCSFKRTIIPEDALNTDLELLVSTDSSIDIGIAAIHGRIQRKNGKFSCTLIAAKSKLAKGTSVPRAELKAAVLGSTLFHTVRKNCLDQYKKVTFVSDSTIALYWIVQDYRPLQIAVRNAVIEIRRFTLPEQWFHIESELNLADLETRPTGVTIDDILEDSEWVNGKDWMKLPSKDFPIKPISQLTLENKDKVAAAKEMKAPDIGGMHLDSGSDKIGQRYEFSKYPVDPCSQRWSVSVGTLAMLFRVADMAKRRPRSRSPRPTEDELKRAEQLFFRLATKEVKHFSKRKDWEPNSIMKDKILYRTDRVLEGREYNSLENVLTDVEPLHFVKPIVDRYSPVAYSLMMFCHVNVLHHQNANSTPRESLNYAHILQGKDLAVEIRDKCPFCRRYKRKLLEVELGNVHKNRLTVAPCFYYVQVDIAGPFDAICEHNHRALVKVWALIFKCPATCAISVHVMTMYNTSAFVTAYTRFASRYGHCKKMFIDAGSQLIKGCKEMCIGILDLTNPISVQFNVGLEFEVGPVGAHYTQGQVERSILEVRKLFQQTYRGLKLDIMSYETAFSWVANELNCMPLFLGSKYRNLDHLDLITPSRLLLGRNNRRAMAGCATFDRPSRIMEQMIRVYEAWWDVWKREKIADFIPRSSKWPKTGYQPQVGDIVIFPRDGSADRVYGDPSWRVGRVKELLPCSDNLARKVILEYKNASEDVFRETHRSVRDMAVLLPEGESILADELNAASKRIEINYQSSATTTTNTMTPWSWGQSTYLPASKEALGPRFCDDHEIKCTNTQD